MSAQAGWLLPLSLLLLVRGTLAFSVPIVCETNGSVYYVGEWYYLDTDHCTQCECTAGGPVCGRTDCPALPPPCIHVSYYPNDCCPRCEKIGCEHRGQVYELGQQFQVNEAVVVESGGVEALSLCVMGCVTCVEVFVVCWAVRV